tara:strand:+ start:39 stop:863 length:825 start_codon:yes stop_codon:yes gene_type:complete
MDLSLLSDEQLQQMFDMGNFAAGAELASRKNAPEKIIEEAIVPTPIREFGDMRVGRKDQAIFGDSVGQRYKTDNPELFFNTAEGKAEADEEQNFFDFLQNLSGGVVDFAKDLGSRFVASQVGTGAGGMVFGPIGALAGGIFGALKGGNLFSGGKGMAPELQQSLYNQYGSDSAGRLSTGIMAGYNPRGGNLLTRAVDRRQNILNALNNPRARASGFTGVNYDPLTDFINQQVKEQTEYYGGTGATDVTGSPDYTSTGSPQSMGSARGGAGGRPY